MDTNGSFIISPRISHRRRTLQAGCRTSCARCRNFSWSRRPSTTCFRWTTRSSRAFLRRGRVRLPGGPSLPIRVRCQGSLTATASVRRIAVAPRRQGPGRSEVSRGLALFRGSQHHVAGSSGEIRTLEQRLETVLAIKPNRDFARLPQFLPATIQRLPLLPARHEVGWSPPGDEKRSQTYIMKCHLLAPIGAWAASDGPGEVIHRLAWPQS